MNVTRYIDLLQPSILISEIYAPWLEEDFRILQAMEQVVDSGFYRCVEIAPLRDASARRTLRGMLERNGLRCVCWETKSLIDSGLNPSTLDKAMREKTIGKLVETVKAAAECGAQAFAMVSGADPGKVHREEARQGLLEVVSHLVPVLRDCDMKFYLEPLDREKHKNQLIGPIPEAMNFINSVRRIYPESYIAWDSAHVALNGEDPEKSIVQAGELISQFHLANAVTDPASSLYGDHHIPPGKPGFLDDDTVRTILDAAVQISFAPGMMRSIAVEARSTSQDNLSAKERRYREWLSLLLQEEVRL